MAINETSQEKISGGIATENRVNQGGKAIGIHNYVQHRKAHHLELEKTTGRLGVVNSKKWLQRLQGNRASPNVASTLANN